MCILDLSKVLTPEFHYDHIKNKYGNNPTLLLNDTDILMCEIKKKYVYKDFNEDKEMFDFSIYPLLKRFVIKLFPKNLL